MASYDLPVSSQVPEQSGGAVDPEHEHPGRHRVQRACVTDLAGAGQAPYACDDVVGGHAARLVDDDQTARRCRSADGSLFVEVVEVAGARGFL